jgi:hypothetical protein
MQTQTVRDDVDDVVGNGHTKRPPAKAKGNGAKGNGAKTKAKGNGAKGDKPEKKPVEKPDKATELKAAETSLVEKYGNRIVRGSLQEAGTSKEHGNKRTVMIKCEYQGCHETRRIATSDLHQVKYCPEHIKQVRLEKRKDLRAKNAKPKVAKPKATKTKATKVKAKGDGAKTKAKTKGVPAPVAATAAAGHRMVDEGVDV